MVALSGEHFDVGPKITVRQMGARVVGTADEAVAAVEGKHHDLLRGVLAPGSEGELGILPNHAPLLTTLSMGVIRVQHEGEEQIFTITGGVLEVRPDIVTVLADVGERIDEIDEEEQKQPKLVLRSC